MQCHLMPSKPSPFDKCAPLMHRQKQWRSVKEKNQIFPKNTVNRKDLFSAQCAKESLVLVNILVEKSFPFCAPCQADVFQQSCQHHFTGQSACLL